MAQFEITVFIQPELLIIILLLVFPDQGKYSEKSENIISLDSCIRVFAIRTPFGFISVFGLTFLLKLDITVCFLWLSLPDLSGSLKKIYSSKQTCRPTFRLNVFIALIGTLVLFTVFRFGAMENTICHM